MWQRFTERARRVVFFAQEEAGRLGRDIVDTEHLLLGLVRESDSVAARILDRQGVRLGRIRSETERQAARGEHKPGKDMHLAPGGKRAIDLAYAEARRLHNNYIGTEHLLLGVMREENGLAGRVLAGLGATAEAVRDELLKLQDARPTADGTQLLKRIKELPPAQRDALAGSGIAAAELDPETVMLLDEAVTRGMPGDCTVDWDGARVRIEWMHEADEAVTYRLHIEGTLSIPLTTTKPG